MIKVLHIISTLQGGGRERRMTQVIKGFINSEEIMNSLVVLNPERIDYKEPYELEEHLHLLKGNSRLKNNCEILKVIISERPDVIHCWCMNIVLLLFIILVKPFFRFKLVSGFVADGCTLPKYGFSRFTTKLSFFVSEKIVSNSMAGLVAKEAPLKKSVVIHNGFDYNRFKPFDVETLRSSLNLNNSFVVTMVARFDEAKDWMAFLNMIQYINSKVEVEEVRFLAVGKGPNLKFYVNKSKEMRMENVVFTGFRTDVEQIIRISDVCVLFSNDGVHAEGISNSILEAMAAGKIVIATMGGGTPEIIDDKINGFIVSPSNYIDAGEIILRIMKGGKIYSNIGNCAKKKIQEEFLLSGMLDNYKNLYKSLM